jgi:hypothetical protein
LDAKKLAFQKGIEGLINQTHNKKGQEELKKLLGLVKAAIRDKKDIEAYIQTLEGMALSGLIPRREALQIVRDQRDPEKIWTLTL